MKWTANDVTPPGLLHDAISHVICFATSHMGGGGSHCYGKLFYSSCELSYLVCFSRWNIASDNHMTHQPWFTCVLTKIIHYKKSQLVYFTSIRSKDGRDLNSGSITWLALQKSFRILSITRTTEWSVNTLIKHWCLSRIYIQLGRKCRFGSIINATPSLLWK